MAFKNPHVSLASISVDSSLDGTTDILVIETDLHLNKRHSDYDFLTMIFRPCNSYYERRGSISPATLIKSRISG